MSLPTHEHLSVQTIPNAGRGAIANHHIPAGTTILSSAEPAAHVIFRQYRKEVCAHCFEYDRGRTLPVRDSETGKVFSSDRCREAWLSEHGVLGNEAWRALHVFVQSKSKAIARSSGALPSSSMKPSREVVERAWSKAEEQVRLYTWSQPMDDASRPPPARASNRTQAKSLSQPWTKHVDPNILSYFLSGVLFRSLHPNHWQKDVLCLAMDEEPYRSTEDLAAHCNSFVQLCTIVPGPLLESCTADVCRTLINAGSHNAFGIRSGSDDGEEYAGYALYPSASYFNHSCTPNILKRRVGGSWEFVTARDVDESEECCITYLGGDEKHLTVSERRARLSETWGFECICGRCLFEAGSGVMI
ncbi:hypothetical protein LTR85_009834 [Meristemomyces frigidus]|nr:hypothetical protein LTR85_009834 [Meristemomyces frigidus]